MKSALLCISLAVLAAQDDVRTRPADSNTNPGFRPPRYSARFVVEGGTKPEGFQARLACLGIVFGSGVIEWQSVVLDPENYPDQPVGPYCFAVVEAAGVHPWRGVLGDGRVIVLKKLGLREGSSVSLTTLTAPPAARKHYDKGVGFLLRKRFPDAVKEFEQALAIYPKYATAESEYGRALEEMGRVDDAKQHYLAAAEMDGRYLRPLVQLAALEAGREDWRQVILYSERAIALNAAEFPGAHYYRGMAALASKEWAEAERYFAKCLQLDTMPREYPRTALYLAMSQVELNKKAEAGKVLQAFLQSRPPRPEGLLANEYLQRLGIAR